MRVVETGSKGWADEHNRIVVEDPDGPDDPDAAADGAPGPRSGAIRG